MSNSKQYTPRPWTQTYLGQKYYPNFPRAEDVNIVDIAHSLGMQCRFNGHTDFFYSVAQHSVLVSYVVPPELALQGLLHDAAEAYVGDVISPVKAQLKLYSRIEDLNHIAIAVRYGLPYTIPPVTPPEIKRADLVALATEARDVMGGQTAGDWQIGVEPLKEIIKPETPGYSKANFLARFRELGGI